MRVRRPRGRSADSHLGIVRAVRWLHSLNNVRLIVIGVLLFRLTPIGSESVEALIAMVTNGDHAPDHDAAPDPEHGCTVHQRHPMPSDFAVRERLPKLR